MAAMLFIEGLPGSGKSAVARHITEYVLQKYLCSTRRFNDYEILQTMFNHDNDGQFKPAEVGGFDVLDLSAFDIALQRLEQVVTDYLSIAKEDEIIIIEFSRNDYHRAFALFHESFLKDAFFLHLNTQVETCKQRIRKRSDEPVYDDDYPVSDYIFEEYYHSDDGKSLPTILAEHRIDQSRVLSLVNNDALDVISPRIDQFIENFIYSMVQSGNLLAQPQLI